MNEQPPESMIELARQAAMRSPCDKSKRGAVVYVDMDLDGSTVFDVSTGFNGPPGDGGCPGRVTCGDKCRMRCMHAEARALRDAFAGQLGPQRLGRLSMLHVKVINGVVVAGGGPGCVMCSREILDSGRIHGIWLFRELHDGFGQWCYYEAKEFHAETCAALGIP